MRNRVSWDQRLELRPVAFAGLVLSAITDRLPRTAISCHRPATDLPPAAINCHDLPVLERSWPRPAVAPRTPMISPMNLNWSCRDWLGRICGQGIARIACSPVDQFTRKARSRPSSACHRLPHRSNSRLCRGNLTLLDPPPLMVQSGSVFVQRCRRWSAKSRQHFIRRQNAARTDISLAGLPAVRFPVINQSWGFHFLKVDHV